MSASGARSATTPAWVVGGAIRDELLGRDVVDVDVACADPELAARLYSRLAGGAVFPLSERHGAWRVAFRERQHGRLHAPARGDDRGRPGDPRLHRERDRPPARRRTSSSIRSAASRTWRRAACAPSRPRSSRTIPCGSCGPSASRTSSGFRLDDETEALLRSAADQRRRAGRRADPRRARAAFARRLAPRRRARAPRAARRLGRAARPRSTSSTRPDSCSSSSSGRSCSGSRSRTTCAGWRARCFARSAPADASPRAIHRFRRRTEPWALSALAFLGATDLYERRARRPRRRAARAAAPRRRRARARSPRRARRSGACSSWSRRSGRPGRSRRGTRRSTSSGARPTSNSLLLVGVGQARHLMVQPTGGVSCTSGSAPASAASSAGRRYGSAPSGSVWLESGAPW